MHKKPSCFLIANVVYLSCEFSTRYMVVAGHVDRGWFVSSAVRDLPRDITFTHELLKPKTMCYMSDVCYRLRMLVYWEV